MQQALPVGDAADAAGQAAAGYLPQTYQPSPWCPPSQNARRSISSRRLRLQLYLSLRFTFSSVLYYPHFCSSLPFTPPSLSLYRVDWLF